MIVKHNHLFTGIIISNIHVIIQEMEDLSIVSTPQWLDITTTGLLWILLIMEQMMFNMNTST